MVRTSPLADKGHFEASFIADAEQLAGTRHEFEGWLRSLGSGADQVGEMAVVLSELGSNAVRAALEDGRYGAEGYITVRARCVEETITLEVLNAEGGSAPTERWDQRELLREGGRGLMIVAAYTDDIDVDNEGDRLLLRVRSALRP